VARIRDHLLLCVAMLASGVTPALATMRIVNDRGGTLVKYFQAFTRVRSTGERVVVDGDCLSACTMLLGLLPSNQICATPRARFGFHVASIVNHAGQLVASAKDTQALWEIYPPSVQRWINEHGGLSRQMIYMGGRELNRVVAACDRPTLRAVLAAGAVGYSGTLRPIVPDQPSVRVFSTR